MITRIYSIVPFFFPKNPDSEDMPCLDNDPTARSLIVSAKIYAGKRRTMRQQQKEEKESAESSPVSCVTHASLYF